MMRLTTLFFYTILFSCCWPALSVHAASALTARVEPTSITQDETFNLSLTLNFAIDPKQSGSQLDDVYQQSPDLTPLHAQFNILGQTVSESTQVINGKITRQKVWYYELEPKKTGQLIIPALTLDFSSGAIRSQPVTVTVKPPSASKADGSRLEVSVSNAQPYLYEPIYYTMRFIHRGELRDLQALPPSENVLIKPLPDSNKSVQQIINGEAMIVSEVTYLLTPLRSGEWQLPAGQIVGQKVDSRNSSFGGGFFSFSSPRPVTFRSDAVKLNVQPAQHQPWLPAQSVALSEQWESDIKGEVMVGVPIIRSLTLTVDGGGTQPLPDLTEYLPEQTELRVRSPDPETDWQLQQDGRSGRSSLKQSFSLTPLQVGTMTLPEIRFPWWDLTSNSVQWATLPAQTLTVVPNPTLAQPTPTAALPPIAATAAPAVTYVENIAFSPLQYGLLTAAVLALFAALGQSIYSRNKVCSVETTPAANAPKRLNLAWLRQQFASTNDLRLLRHSLQQYAHYRWAVPVSITLPQLALYVLQHCQNGNSFAALIQQLDQVLYGGQAGEFEVKAWKAALLTTLADVTDKTAETQTIATFAPLNPAV